MSSCPLLPIEVSPAARPEQRADGPAHIARAFAAARAEGRPALMPYFTLGYPDLATSRAIVHALAAAGADLIELGVPFSDPLADGPTIQRASHVALSRGTTLARCLELTARLRDDGVQQPLLLMSYVNPILAWGLARFVADAVDVGADGLIIPDLPPEEAEELEGMCRSTGLALVYLAAPTSSPERLAMAAARTQGFLYLVSLTGVTGARAALPAGLAAFVQRARRVAKTPLAVGFGISTPEQARAVGQVADGVIVGSALLDAVRASADPVRAAGDFLRRLRLALGAVYQMPGERL